MMWVSEGQHLDEKTVCHMTVPNLKPMII